MLKLSPDIIVLTNIQADHLDYYKDLADIIHNFQAFIDGLKENQTLILNNDDLNSARLKKPTARIITYGINNSSDLLAQNISVDNERQVFDLIWRGQPMGQFVLPLPSLFNVYNTLAAAALSLDLGVKPDTIKKVLADFHGLWRRFQVIGKYKGVSVYSDYAHHPDAISGVIAGFEQFYPDKRLLVVFQPHQHARTKTLFKQFTACFSQADLVIINEIYSVPGREDAKWQDVSSRDLVDEIKKKGQTAIYTKNFSETIQAISDNVQKDDLILILGAGDIYKVGEELVK
jgi:UDP-N-acetylmuramate--alanine ligase